MPESLETPRRPAFYGRRRGKRLRQRGQNLIRDLLPRIAIPRPCIDDHPDDPRPHGHLDPRSLFDTPLRAVWLEIGFGGGEHLAEQAATHPDIGLIGCEVFVNGVASLLNHIDRRGLRNVRVFADDARHLLPAFPDGCLERAFVLFPDPWPKKRHAERRFIGPENLPVLARLLKPGSELRVASDDPTYIDWARRHLADSVDFDLVSETTERPPGWAPTRYEAKALRQGKSCTYFTALRR